MHASNLLFAALVVVAVAMFLVNGRRLILQLRLGRTDDSRRAQVAERLGNLVQIGIFQRKIFRDSVAGPMHAAIFWGFCILTAGTVEFVFAGIFPSFS